MPAPLPEQDSNRYVDLHLHSNHSDGTDTPSEVAARAAALGFSAIALTDHDSVAGVEEASSACRERGLEFLSGVEISASFQRSEVHVLGLGVDSQNRSLIAALDILRAGRHSRASQMISRLQELGTPIEMDHVTAETTETGIIGRMHIARELLRMGTVRTVQHAFDAFLNPGRPAYVPKSRLECAEAVACIHEAGGMAFVAHPGIGTTGKLLPRLLALSFDGIEVYHVKHTPGQIAQYSALATERNLLITGGSDCHGTAKRHPEMGKVRVPYVHFERIKTGLGVRS